MIIAIGLPRSGGQTLQQCLAHLLGGQVIHSPGNRLEEFIEDGKTVAMVEVFAPLLYLQDTFDDLTLIYNSRDHSDWLKSCEKVYERSQHLNWNHPIWRYPLSQFSDYRGDYEEALDSYPVLPVSYINVVDNPSWDDLCDVLGVPIPDAPFPNIDYHSGRDAPHEQPIAHNFPSPW